MKQTKFYALALAAAVFAGAPALAHEGAAPARAGVTAGVTSSHQTQRSGAVSGTAEHGVKGNGGNRKRSGAVSGRHAAMGKPGRSAGRSGVTAARSGLVKARAGVTAGKSGGAGGVKDEGKLEKSGQRGG